MANVKQPAPHPHADTASALKFGDSSKMAARNHATMHKHIPESQTSHPNDPIPEEPSSIAQHAVPPTMEGTELSPRTSEHSLNDSDWSNDESVSTPRTEPQVGEVIDDLKDEKTLGVEFTKQPRRGSTHLITSNAAEVRELLGNTGATTQLVEKVCCGGGCCLLEALPTDPNAEKQIPVVLPDNDAFRSLKLKLGNLSLDSKLTRLALLPDQTVSLHPISAARQENGSEKTAVHHSTVEYHPPRFVTPHAPYEVYSARIFNSRELTKPGAEKRTFHFDLDVTDYPTEGGNVDFVVGGAIGISAPNEDDAVDELFNILGVPKFVRDKPVSMRTTSGRWPTIWGDDVARELITTRRELLTWCSDFQSYPPTKMLLRLLGEYATAKNEKQILMYLCSAQGQASFCDLRTGPYITVPQLLHAFPSARPPLDHLLSILPQLMPRFYSLSNDPHISSSRNGLLADRRLIEIAVTVHETPHWKGAARKGVGSGFMERCALKFLEARQSGTPKEEIDVRVPMFRGLMANPLAREFVTDGPMLLVGAGVGIAPFRGFVQRRLQSANCANKVWVLQGIRDSLVDELYSGEWGVEEEKVKKVVQSRRGQGRYVQEEVRNQADLVWYIINALDGRVFVCGSSKGMGEGVEAALVDVAMGKGKLNYDEAVEFWKEKKASGQYITETW